MYLADTEILARIEQFGFMVSPDYAPFDADIQVQPCSVDLRLGPRFWTVRSGTSFDMRKQKLLEVAPRRRWRQYDLTPGQSIAVKPGSMVLGHVLEQIAMPVDCAGRIQGRSSFARLGLMVHCSADFINPGWRGRFPLQLVNLGSSVIHLYPGMPVCQMLVVSVHGKVSRPYGAVSLASRYFDDDGGPSYWWRDKLVDELLGQMRSRDVTLSAQNDILSRIGGLDYDAVARLESFIAGRGSLELSSDRDILLEFARVEERRKNAQRLFRQGPLAAAAILTTTTLSSLFATPIGFWHYATWTMTGLAAASALLAALHVPRRYFGLDELHQRDLERRDFDLEVAQRSNEH